MDEFDETIETLKEFVANALDALNKGSTFGEVWDATRSFLIENSANERPEVVIEYFAGFAAAAVVVLAGAARDSET